MSKVKALNKTEVDVPLVVLVIEDGKSGTEIGVHLSERSAYEVLMNRILAGEEANPTWKPVVDEAKFWFQSGAWEELVAVLDMIRDPVFQYTLATKSVVLPGAALAVELESALRELVRCVRGGDQTAGVSMDDALIDADEVLSTFNARVRS